MAKQPQCTVDIYTDGEHRYRAIAFLKYPGVKYVDAKDVFDGFDEDTQNYFRKSFDLWIGDPFKGRPDRITDGTKANSAASTLDALSSRIRPTGFTGSYVIQRNLETEDLKCASLPYMLKSTLTRRMRRISNAPRRCD